MSIDSIKILFLGLSAVVLSCSKIDSGTAEPGKDAAISAELTLSGAEASKAYVFQNDGEEYMTMWEDGDSMAVWFDNVSAAMPYAFVNDIAFELCSFKGSVTESPGKHTLYGCYPFSAVVAGSGSSSSVRMKLPVNQVPMWGASDGCADWLVMKPAEFQLAQCTQLENIRFARVNSIVKFTPIDNSAKNLLQGESIISVVLKIDGVALAGTASVNLADASVSGWTETADSVKASYGQYDYFTVNGYNAVYFCVKPSVIAAGSNMELTVITTAHKATKKVLTKAMEFRHGNISAINVSYSDNDISDLKEPPTPPVPQPSNLPEWPEAPSTPQKKGDYYYTYHITDVNNSKGEKARNYCCCYSKEYMCPMWVAAPMHDFYAVKNTDRTDAYQTDPNFNFTQVGKWDGYTRGHMLGSAERLVSNTTNKQVFYWSNIAPQIQTYFNTGGGVWNDCEDYFCDTQWVGHKDTTYMVTGCWWDPDSTPKYVNGTRIPTHYYKILLRTKKHVNKYVCSCTADELQCIAVLLEHKAYSKLHYILPSTYSKAGVFRSVKQMEELTGFTFFPNVPNAPKDTYNASDWPTSK